MNGSDLSALVARAASGEPEAFTELVARHHALVMRWALAIEGDTDEAEDLAQAAWIKVFRSLSAYRGDSKFTTWLYRIVMNTGIELHRTVDRRRDALAAWHEGLDAPPGSVEALETIDAERLRAVVVAFLDHLPQRQRQIFALADLEGRSNVEISEMLEIPDGTVRSILFRARRTIRLRILKELPGLIKEFRS